jgi:CheY-like chemotaxis protein
LAAQVWVIDDSPMILEIVGTIVTEMGHDVTSFSLASDAASKIDGASCDLVISDVHMPTMDGFELTRKLRAHADHVATPILLLTADSSESFAEQCKAAGVTAWVKKPFQPTDIERQVRRFIMD